MSELNHLKREVIIIGAWRNCSTVYALNIQFTVSNHMWAVLYFERWWLLRLFLLFCQLSPLPPSSLWKLFWRAHLELHCSLVLSQVSFSDVLSFTLRSKFITNFWVSCCFSTFGLTAEGRILTQQQIMKVWSQLSPIALNSWRIHLFFFSARWLERICLGL